MRFDTHKTIFIKRLVLRAAKWPILYTLLGSAFIALGLIDDIFPITHFKDMFDFTNLIGEIFLCIAGITFLYKLVIIACRHYEKKLGKNHLIASLIVASLRKGIRIIYFLVIFNVIITLLNPTAGYTELVNKILNTLIIAAIGWIAIQILYTFESVLYQKMLRLERKNQIRAKALYTKTHIIRNIATVIIIIITIAAVLMSFNSVKNIGISLLASAGFLTAIIGLAAQRTLFSLFSGLQIALAHPIKIGDVVVIDKESGIIEEITLTYVMLKLGDRRRLTVPISYFIEKPFENWSHDPESMRSSFVFYIDYMMPIEPLREELNRILHASALWDGRAGKLQIANLTERAVEVRIQVSAANADNLSDLRAEVREKMLGFIREQYPVHFPQMRFNTAMKDTAAE